MNNNGLVYSVNEKPPFGKNLLFAFQQFLAIIAATILVPILANSQALNDYGVEFQHLNQASALIGAGVGTLVYLLFTKFKSPVFLGSSFAFISPLATACAYGYFGIILGSLFAGLVYVIIALLVKIFGSNWINKLMPPVIIGPTVALIGLSLSGSAMNNLMNVAADSTEAVIENGEAVIKTITNYNVLAILVGIVSFLIVVIASVKGNKTLKMFPFIIGVLGGYVMATLITLIGYYGFGSEYCQLVNFTPFTTIGTTSWIPKITIIGAFKGEGNQISSFADVVSVFVAFAPVALVVFAEHVADHKNISSIIGSDLLKEPGLHRTLLGDGVGSFAGALFGGCPNTTYGESIGCVAITGNASVWTILTTAIICIVIAFFYPAVAFVETIPSCVVGGICIALYGFIAVSGLRMFKNVDLDNSKNLFIVASILVCGLGGLKLTFGKVTISSIACALILGIILNVILKPAKAEVKKEAHYEVPVEETMFGTVASNEKTSSQEENK